MSQVSIDDQDPRIIYSDFWGHQPLAGCFSETVSTALLTGSTASFNFVGLSYILEVFGCFTYTRFFACRYQSRGLWSSRLH